MARRPGPMHPTRETATQATSRGSPFVVQAPSITPPSWFPAACAIRGGHNSRAAPDGNRSACGTTLEEAAYGNASYRTLRHPGIRGGVRRVPGLIHRATERARGTNAELLHRERHGRRLRRAWKPVSLRRERGFRERHLVLWRHAGW